MELRTVFCLLITSCVILILTGCKPSTKMETTTGSNAALSNNPGTHELPTTKKTDEWQALKGSILKLDGVAGVHIEVVPPKDTTNKTLISVGLESNQKPIETAGQQLRVLPPDTMYRARKLVGEELLKRSDSLRKAELTVYVIQK